jgi:hypothetical protein
MTRRVAWILLSLVFPCLALAQFQDMPKGPVTIVVQDEAGTPVPGAEVHCVNWNFGPRFTELMPEEKAFTNLDGRVTFQNRTIGEAFARVQSGALGGWFRLTESGSDHPVNSVTIGVGRTLRVRTRIPDVLVLAENCLPVGLTDENGNIAIPNHGVGYDPDLAFTKEDYAWESVSFSRDVAILDVQLKPGCVIDGIVLGPDGEPVPDVPVFGGAYLHNPVMTDRAGRLQLTRNPRTEFGGTLQVFASLRRGGESYWGEAHVPVETPIISGIVLQLAHRVPYTYTVRGRVLHGETGEPVKARIVRNSSENLYCVSEIETTDGTGRFSMGVNLKTGFWYFAVPEEPTLFAVGPMVYVSEPEEGAGTPELEFQISDGCAIRGRAVSEDGIPIRNKWVYYEPVGELPYPVETDDDGRFTVGHLDGAGKTYQLTVHDAFGRRASTTAGPLKRGEVLDGVEIVLPAQVEPATLRGTVRDQTGSPVAGIRMRFEYVDQFDPPYVQAITDDHGRFAAEVLYTGKATVTARSLTQQSEGDYSGYYDLPVAAPLPARVDLSTTSNAEQDFIVAPLLEPKP